MHQVSNILIFLGHVYISINIDVPKQDVGGFSSHNVKLHWYNNLKKDRTYKKEYQIFEEQVPYLNTNTDASKIIRNLERIESIIAKKNTRL